MSDDLVKRARHNIQADMPHYASVELIEKMADHIEELEAKLSEKMGEDAYIADLEYKLEQLERAIYPFSVIKREYCNPRAGGVNKTDLTNLRAALAELKVEQP